MSRVSGAIAATAFVGVAGLAIYWGPKLLDSAPAAEPPTITCVVTVDGQGYWLTAEQANNAAIIAVTGWSYGFDDHGVTVALATAIQESSLRNLDYGDRDSLGLFQQRPSQGWGTEEQVTDPRYASAMFYEALARVDAWEQLPVTEAAQAVQRSGFPDAYADHEAEARAWATALGGQVADASCDLAPAEVTTPQAFAERVTLDLGQAAAVDVLGAEGEATVLGLRPASPSDEANRSLRVWATVTASETGVAWVELGDTRWNRDGTTETVADAGYAGVRIGLVTSPTTAD